MSYFSSYTFSTANQFLIDLSNFAGTNGWGISFDGVYNTSYRRLHINKDLLHVDMYSYSTTSIQSYLCTGYSYSSAPYAQPGVDTRDRGFSSYVSAGMPYYLISTNGGLYFVADASNPNWGNVLLRGCFISNMPDKIGSWTGGFGGSALGNYQSFMLSSPYAPKYTTLNINGSWTLSSSGAGVYSTEITNDLSTYAPFYYNAGIMPIPILLNLPLSTDSSKRIPLGFAPGLYRTSGGDIYNVGDVITIGTDDYLIYPVYSSVIGNYSSGDYLFKLGS